MEQKLTEVAKFQKNQVIFREGDKGQCMYDVLNGSVGIYADYGRDSERPLTVLEKGKFFGEMGMVRGLPRSATAVALEDETELRVINWNTLGEYFRSEPSRVVQVMQQMSRRIEELTRDYMGACAEIVQIARERREEQEKEQAFRKAVARSDGDRMRKDLENRRKWEKYIADYETYDRFWRA